MLGPRVGQGGRGREIKMERKGVPPQRVEPFLNTHRGQDKSVYKPVARESCLKTSFRGGGHGGEGGLIKRLVRGGRGKICGR